MEYVCHGRFEIWYTPDPDEWRELRRRAPQRRETDGQRGWRIISERDGVGWREGEGERTGLEVDQEGELVGRWRSGRLETILGVDIIHPTTPIAKVFQGNGCNVGSRRVLDYYGNVWLLLTLSAFEFKHGGRDWTVIGILIWLNYSYPRMMSWRCVR